jgi:hypothetical protein
MEETTFSITSIVGGRRINKEITFSQAVTEARRWKHGSRNHADGMHDLYMLFRAVNGYYANFKITTDHPHGYRSGYNQLWDWVDETEENN